MTIFQVQTTLTLGDGSRVVLPIRVFSDKDKAEALRAERQQKLAGLLKTSLVHVAGDQAEEAGLTFGEALSELGVLAFGNSVLELEVEDSRIITRLVMP